MRRFKIRRYAEHISLVPGQRPIVAWVVTLRAGGGTAFWYYPTWRAAMDFTDELIQRGPGGVAKELSDLKDHAYSGIATP